LGRVHRHFAWAWRTYADFTTGIDMQTSSSSDGPLQLEPPKRRRTTYLPRIPLVLAQEIGSFLERDELRICLTQVCSSGLSFLSVPANSPRTAILAMQTLIRSCYIAVCSPTTSWSLYDEPTSTLYPKVGELVVERIASLLSLRPHIQRFVLKVDRRARKCRRHFTLVNELVYNQLNQVGCEEARLQGRNAAIEWQVCANTIKSLAPFRALHRLDFFNVNVKKFPGLASCRTLHTVDISRSKIVNLAALASCQALHTLNIRDSDVVDVSVLNSCQALREVDLSRTDISDVSALASCPELSKADLSHTSISDVSVLASCPALRKVDLGFTDITDVSVLESCPELRTVYLDGTLVTDVSVFGSCRYLETLTVSDTTVSDVSVLASSQTLRMLEITFASVTDVSALVDCVSLRTLRCSSGPKPSGYAEVERIIKARVRAAR
jgi:hypothetical protein